MTDILGAWPKVDDPGGFAGWARCLKAWREAVPLFARRDQMCDSQELRKRKVEVLGP